MQRGVEGHRAQPNGGHQRQVELHFRVIGLAPEQHWTNAEDQARHAVEDFGDPGSIYVVRFAPVKITRRWWPVTLSLRHIDPLL